MSFQVSITAPKGFDSSVTRIRWMFDEVDRQLRERFPEIEAERYAANRTDMRSYRMREHETESFVRVTIGIDTQGADALVEICGGHDPTQWFPLDMNKLLAWLDELRKTPTMNTVNVTMRNPTETFRLYGGYASTEIA